MFENVSKRLILAGSLVVSMWLGSSMYSASEVWGQAQTPAQQPQTDTASPAPDPSVIGGSAVVNLASGGLVTGLVGWLARMLSQSAARERAARKAETEAREHAARMEERASQLLERLREANAAKRAEGGDE
jgi:hypothetical protein